MFWEILLKTTEGEFHLVPRVSHHPYLASSVRIGTHNRFDTKNSPKKALVFDIRPPAARNSSLSRKMYSWTFWIALRAKLTTSEGSLTLIVTSAAALTIRPSLPEATPGVNDGHPIFRIILAFH